jgi:hypothetical protein
MKLPAAVPQEANFSLIGGFGNCPLVVRKAAARP